MFREIISHIFLNPCSFWKKNIQNFIWLYEYILSQATRSFRISVTFAIKTPHNFCCNLIFYAYFDMYWKFGARQHAYTYLFEGWAYVSACKCCCKWVNGIKIKYPHAIRFQLWSNITFNSENCDQTSRTLTFLIWHQFFLILKIDDIC